MWTRRWSMCFGNATGLKRKEENSWEKLLLKIWLGGYGLGLREVMEGEGDRVRADVGKTEDVMLTQNSKTSADVDVFYLFQPRRTSRGLLGNNLHIHIVPNNKFINHR